MRMKKEAKNQRADIGNSVLYLVYSNIDTQLTAEELAAKEGISAHHLHRIWRKETGKKPVRDNQINQTPKSGKPFDYQQIRQYLRDSLNVRLRLANVFYQGFWFKI
jgi:methylphosphotriester-DNA--protein-cysteine methyltransferase